MNKASAYRITNASLLKNYIFGAFTCYKAGTLQDALIIHRRPEMYYEGVLKGARLIADECAKDLIFQ